MRLAIWLFCFPFLAWAQSEPTCGNGVVDTGEECDAGAQNADTGVCTSQCRTAFCGDGFLASGYEECDDSNTINYDGCFECKEVARSDIFDTPKPKPMLDPNVAFRLSIATTLFGPPTLGLIYGPSMGHFYAGEIGHGVATSLLRAGLVTGQIISGVLLTKSSFRIGDKTYTGENLGALMVVDGIALIGLVYYDLLDGPRAVARANKKK